MRQGSCKYCKSLRVRFGIASWPGLRVTWCGLHAAFLWRLVRHRPWPWCSDLLLFTLLVLLDAAPGLIGRAFFDQLPGAAPGSGEAGLGLPGWLWLLAAAHALQALAMTAMMFGLMLARGRFVYQNAALLQRNMLAGILALPGARALASTPGEAISRFRDDADEAAGLMMGLNGVAGVTLATLVAAVFLSRIDAALTALVFAPLVLVVAVLQQAHRRLQRYRRASREATGAVTEFIGEMMGAVQAVQLAGAVSPVIRRFRGLNEARRRAAVRDRLFDALLGSIFWNAADLGTGLILLLAAPAMLAGTFTVGEFALFSYALGYATIMTTEVGRVLARYQRLGVSLERMATLVHGPAEVAVPRGASAGGLPGPAVAPGSRLAPWLLSALVRRDAAPVCGAPSSARRAAASDALRRLDVSELSYRHPGSERGCGPLSFSLRGGTLTVITGPVGAGKTTLLRVLLGLLPRDGGRVCWNGVEVPDLAAFMVPPRCAYTPQVPRLFSETLRDNILLGLPESAVDLPRALYQAVLEADVAVLERGLETLVGPRGVRLSGGQAQRAAAARMLVRSPELLVVDDLSSALDVETEHALWERLLAGRRRTILAVSHRAALLRRADGVLRLEDGHLTHELG
ncbi:MAG TPA: ABC transporter ATP-binding protein [Chloroflexota bacterium]|nr:ABC transporter ATP-binding protein [Chloroflexota bacterium]